DTTAERATGNATHRQRHLSRPPSMGSVPCRHITCSLTAATRLGARPCGRLDRTLRPPGRRCDPAPDTFVGRAWPGGTGIATSPPWVTRKRTRKEGLRWQVQPAAPGTRSIPCFATMHLVLNLAVVSLYVVNL